MLNIYDDFTTMGDHVEIGNSAIIGAYVGIGAKAEIGDFARIGDYVEIGAEAEIGLFAKIGDNAKIGNSAEIGKFAEIGVFAKIGDNARIGNRVGIGASARIGNFAEIGVSAKIGDGAEIGDFARIGDSVKINDRVEIGDYAEIGYGVEIGDKFRCEGLKVIDFFTMANVDGTGRRIHVYVHTEGITIRAGCFKGTLNEFCMKAEDEGKTLYARTVRAAAEAFADELRQQGKTGGWDCSNPRELQEWHPAAALAASF